MFRLAGGVMGGEPRVTLPSGSRAPPPSRSAGNKPKVSTSASARTFLEGPRDRAEQAKISGRSGTPLSRPAAVVGETMDSIAVEERGELFLRGMASEAHPSPITHHSDAFERRPLE
ncbi:hypothetical protein NHX12_020298 [Muraenolepis orangiensis]|uniref:Uncharacterized protein n=1 Tax=Muraenolepis orangiensis TaxID=630683 RepID=A0A9Q0EUM9_9TELE|nr:hypothetical protein NHX12_020298 [Muraenolepis orangiensis]